MNKQEFNNANRLRRRIALIEDKALAENISEGAYELAHSRNNDEFVVSRQMEIYETMTNYEK